MEYKKLDSFHVKEIKELINCIFPDFKIYEINNISEEQIAVICKDRNQIEQNIVMMSDCMLLEGIEIEEKQLFLYRQYMIARGYSKFWENNTFSGNLHMELEESIDNMVFSTVNKYLRKYCTQNKDVHQYEIKYEAFLGKIKEKDLRKRFLELEDIENMINDKLFCYIYACGLDDGLAFHKFKDILRR